MQTRFYLEIARILVSRDISSYDALTRAIGARTITNQERRSFAQGEASIAEGDDVHTHIHAIFIWIVQLFS
jgi:hypothetical protein